jgi:acetyl-CoA acetyltransferase
MRRARDARARSIADSHPDKRRPIKALVGAADVDFLADAREDHSVFMDSYAKRARARIERNGWSPADFARIVVKNRRHAVRNPGVQFCDAMTVDEVLSSRMITEPLTLPMCSPIGDGAAALIVTGVPNGADVPIRIRRHRVRRARGV